MSPQPPAEEYQVMGRMPPETVAEKLREMGDVEAAAEILAGDSEEGDVFGWFDREPPAYLHTAHAFGYIAPPDGDERHLEIQHAGGVAADESLRGARLNVVLDEFRVAAYPGSGVHHVLFDFSAQNQASEDAAELVHFNQVCRGMEGGRVGVLGYPLFVGLRAGSEGLAFRCSTVNVKNEHDEALLGILDNDVFRAGLTLLDAAQPALIPLSSMAVGLTKMVAQRHRNVRVQDFTLGLDFGRGPGGARLAPGQYIAVQIPERDVLVWDWSEWVFDRRAGRVVNRADPAGLVPYNYVSFRVERHYGG